MMKKIVTLFGMLVLSFVVSGCGSGDAPVKATMEGPRDLTVKPMKAGPAGSDPAPMQVIEKP